MDKPDRARLVRWIRIWPWWLQPVVFILVLAEWVCAWAVYVVSSVQLIKFAVVAAALFYGWELYRLSGEFRKHHDRMVSASRRESDGKARLRADLRNADLTGTDLRDAHLSGIDLRGANLTRACFLGADLSGAVFGEDNPTLTIPQVMLARAWSGKTRFPRSISEHLRSRDEQIRKGVILVVTRGGFFSEGGIVQEPAVGGDTIRIVILHAGDPVTERVTVRVVCDGLDPRSSVLEVEMVPDSLPGRARYRGSQKFRIPEGASRLRFHADPGMRIGAAEISVVTPEEYPRAMNRFKAERKKAGGKAARQTLLEFRERNN